jgi:hypothetical protein
MPKNLKKKKLIQIYPKYVQAALIAFHCAPVTAFAIVACAWVTTNNQGE